MENPERKVNLKGLFNEARQSFLKFWTARDARERLILTAAAVVVALSLAYALLIAPALAGREQLGKNMPLLRQQVAQLQVMSREAASLTSKSVSPVAVITKESIEAALVRRGLKPQSVTLTGDSAKVQLTAVSFKDTLSWLGDMKDTARLSVVDANFVALPQADTVNATLTLRQQGNQ